MMPMFVFDMPSCRLCVGQLLIGLINGAFYAMLSLGLAVIFGLLNIINFAHGAQYMLGAFCAWLMLNYFGHRLLAGAHSRAARRRAARRSRSSALLLRHIYELDHAYGLLLTFGLALIIEGVLPPVFRRSPANPTDPAGAHGRRPISASCSCRTIAPG